MKFIVERRIDIGVAEAWENLSRNFTSPDTYSSPLVTGSEVLSEQHRGKGTRYRLLMRNGGHVDEEVVEWIEGRSISSTVVAVKNFPLERMTRTVGVLPIIGEDRSILYVHVDVVPKTNALGKLDALLLARPMYVNSVRQTMRAFELKHSAVLDRRPSGCLCSGGSFRTLATKV